MRQAATYTFPSPWPLQLLLWIAAFALAFCIHATTADAGQRWERKAPIRLARAQGRARAGYPFLQTTANVSQVAANVTGNLPVSVAIGFIRFIARPATPQTFQGSRPCPQKRR
jgi:hypothetical protein